MERRLIEQNPWWEEPAAIEKDRHIVEYNNAKVRFELPNLKINGGLYILRGPRQVGKTTLLKHMIKQRLKTDPPQSILYFNAESGLSLDEAIRDYLDFSDEKKKTIFLDEITIDPKWATKIKYLIDIGKITKNDTVVITGSSSLDLKEGAERLPGRFIEGNEYLFYPYSFRDYIKKDLPSASILNFDIEVAKKLYLNEEIRRSFTTYIKNGGLPPVWNIDRELARERYARWMEGMISRAKKSTIYSRELLEKLGKKTVFDFLGLSKETSIKSHHTVEEYLSFFEACMIGKVLYNYNLAINGPDPKKEKKFIFLDRFISELFYEAREESLIVEDIIGSHLLRVCDRLHFYRDKKGEIDFLCEIEKKLIPIEVKWQKEIAPSDAAPLKKFGRGFLITKDTIATYGQVIAVPAFVFLALIGTTLSKRKIL